MSKKSEIASQEKALKETSRLMSQNIPANTKDAERLCLELAILKVVGPRKEAEIYALAAADADKIFAGFRCFPGSAYRKK